MSVFRSLQSKNIQVFLLGLVVSACSSAEKKNPCLSEDQEPISVCRAREKCQNQTSSVGVGFGVGFGNVGIGLGRSQSTARYERCLDEELSAQQAKAKALTPKVRTGTTSEPESKNMSPLPEKAEKP